MKLAAFDLEIAKEIPDGTADWQALSPLGITCAAVATDGEQGTRFWYGAPQMTADMCRELVRELQALVAAGYTLLTWNGCGFDFRVLAEESGLRAECAELAAQHVDLMLIVTFTKGWFLGLQKALEGAKLKGKLKQVSLSDGTVLNDMNGAQAPRLWAAGEHDAVLAYLRDDVEQLLALAAVVQRAKAIRWTTAGGKPQSVRVPKLLTVTQCAAIPQPDVSWMTNPPRREQFFAWMTA